MQKIIKHNSIPDINEYIINKCIPDPENFTEPFCRRIEKIKCEQHESRKNDLVIFKRVSSYEQGNSYTCKSEEHKVYEYFSKKFVRDLHIQGEESIPI